MVVANIHEAKTNLSKLIEQAEAGEEVVIARNGKPAVRLTPVEPRTRRSADDILASFRAMAPPRRPGEPDGWSGVDEFLAEKHLEAAWEDERVTDEERQQWLARLERFEIWPADLEAFVQSRAP
jgi:prevent-host-death family protein